LDRFVKPGPARLVERAGKQLERYDLAGNIDRAIGDLREATRQDASFTEAHALLGLAWWRRYMQGNDVMNRSEAARSSSNALALNPDSGLALFVLGLVAKDQGNLEAAKDDLRRANDKFSWENGEVLIQLATVFSSLDDESNAMFFAQKAQRVQQKPWYYYNSLGYFDFSQGDVGGAQSNFEAALQIAGDSPKIWLNLGKVLVYQTNRDETDYARKCFTKSLDLSPTDAAYDGLGDLYFSTSNWLDAAGTFQKAAERNPNRYDFPGKAGLSLIHLPETNYQVQAREQLGKAVDKVQSLLKETRDPMAEARLGVYHAALGQAKDAYAALRHALESAPNLLQIRDNVEDAAGYFEEVYHNKTEAENLRQLIANKADGK